MKTRRRTLSSLPSKRALAFLVVTIMTAAIVGTLYNYRHEAYRQIVLQRVADQVADEGTDEDRALALFAEVLRIGNLDPGSAVIDDDPAGTLLRGWGYCDSIAMAFVQVGERMGFEGQLVFLKNPETGTSPHTVATLKVDGEWRVFDVLYRGVSRAADGQLATLEDVATTRAPLTSPKVQAAWFRDPTVFYQTRPAQTLAYRARSAVRWGVSLLPSWTMRFAQDLYIRTQPPTYVETNGTVWEDWQDAADLDYWRARNYDVFGRSDQAKRMYAEVIQSPGSPYAGPARTFLMQAKDRRSIPTYTTQVSR